MPDEHDPTTDKQGNDVSRFVTEALEALRDRPDTYRVLCDYYKTGRLQVWSYKKIMNGGVIHDAIDHGYEVDFVRERGMNAPPGEDAVGYMEILPAENRE